MALINSIEKDGNFLFRYRGQIPVILFVFAVPVIYTTNYAWVTDSYSDILLGICVFVAFLGFYVRAVAIGTSAKHTSGRNTKEQVADSLNTTGIYSTIRHPLYLGNYLTWVGIVGYTFSLWYVLAMSLAYWLYYERIMFAEERFLERKFGDEYLNWASGVPAFIPSRKNHVKGKVPFSLKTVLRREYSGMLATVISFIFIDLLRTYFTDGVVEFTTQHTYVLGVAVVITLVLRSLKHYTKILNESDRS